MEAQNEIQVGDDITVGGKVIFIYSHTHIMIDGGNGDWYLINRKDIKTHRPNRRGEDAER